MTVTVMAARRAERRARDLDLARCLSNIAAQAAVADGVVRSGRPGRDEVLRRLLRMTRALPERVALADAAGQAVRSRIE